MKPAQLESVPPSLCKVMFGLLLASLLLAQNAAAQAITNNFTDGFDDVTPSSVDQYPGTVGGGWSTAWDHRSGSGTTFITPSLVSSLTVVTNGTPLSGGGNYLNWRVGGTSAATANLYRRLDPAGPLNLFFHPYTVEFDYRHDAWITATSTNTTLGTATNASPAMNVRNDYVSFQQANGIRADVGNKVSFWIKSQAAQTSTVPSLLPRTWSFFEGAFASTVETAGLWINSTNVPAELGQVFRFKATIYPLDRLWEGSVTNLTTGAGFDTTVATGRKLRWHSAVASAGDLFGTALLEFISRQQNANTTNEHSLDNIIVRMLPDDLIPPVISNIYVGKFETGVGDGTGPWYSELPSSGRTFYRYNSNFVFTATTYGTNTIPASGVSLNLNGQNVSLTADGTDASQQRTFTFSGLKNNYNYSNVLITVIDGSGRKSTQVSFFDTFDRENSVIVQGYNYNFEPDNTVSPYFPCDGNQIDGIRPDRYLQNWQYGGLIGNLIPTNVVDSYFGRAGRVGVDYVGAPGASDAGNFRRDTCGDNVRIQNELSDDYNRIGDWSSPGDTNASVYSYMYGLNLRNNPIIQIAATMWLNYTREWTKTNYVAYLRAGAGLGNQQGFRSGYLTNWVYELSEVVEDAISSYTNSTQSSNILARFIVPVRTGRVGILYNNPLVDDLGYTRILPLSGKKTLKLSVIQGDASGVGQTNAGAFDYMVFLPVPDIKISNMALSGSDLSFSFNSVENAHYTIQTNSSVSGGTWGAFTTAVGNGGQVTVHHNPIGGGNLYYRVVSP